MCHFVPGEVIALGPLSALNAIDGTDLPGRLTVQPLISEVGELLPQSPFLGIGSATLHTDAGMELFGLSQLSAQLAPSIKARNVLVDLNHILPFGAPPTEAGSLRLSPHAERWPFRYGRFYVTPSAHQRRRLQRDSLHGLNVHIHFVDQPSNYLLPGNSLRRNFGPDARIEI